MTPCLKELYQVISWYQYFKLWLFPFPIWASLDRALTNIDSFGLFLDCRWWSSRIQRREWPVGKVLVASRTLFSLAGRVIRVRHRKSCTPSDKTRNGWSRLNCGRKRNSREWCRGRKIGSGSGVVLAVGSLPRILTGNVQTIGENFWRHLYCHGWVASGTD